MTTLGPFDVGPSLPDPLPQSPFPILKSWLDQALAEAATPNPNSMTLATATPDGRPSARVVLCKGLDADLGSVSFFTNLGSRKARELADNPHAAAVFHWDNHQRQARLEGRVERLPDADADAYFATRAWESRIGAWASRQSEPLESREALLQVAADRILELDIDIAAAVRGDPVEIPRPPFWGGYRLLTHAVELWVSSTGRLHDRALWRRDPRLLGHQDAPWEAVRLQP